MTSFYFVIVRNGVTKRSQFFIPQFDNSQSANFTLSEAEVPSIQPITAEGSNPLFPIILCNPLFPNHCQRRQSSNFTRRGGQPILLFSPCFQSSLYFFHFNFAFFLVINTNPIQLSKPHYNSAYKNYPQAFSN